MKRTDIKGSQIFCGNVRLYEDDEITPPWSGRPNTSEGAVFAELTGAGCRAPETVLTQTRAPQNFEIRGWVTTDLFPMCGSGYPAEEEFFIWLALDLDWTPAPADPGEPPLARLHSMADLLEYIPATNIMKFGGRQVAGVDDSWAGGGKGQVIVHVEVDSWGPSRGKSAYQRLGAPPGWRQCGMEGADPLYFHKDILAGNDDLNAGDYVRIIGTQWRDDTHLHAGTTDDPVDPTDPKQCWAERVPGGDYWAEIHTADKVERLPAPAGRGPDDLIGYAACSPAPAPGGPAVPPLALTDTVVFDTTTRPPGDHIVKVIPALWPGSSATFVPPVFDATSVTFNIQSSGPMLAYYRVIWSSCVPDCANRCGGTDGCGGVCPPRPCGPTQVCDQNGACGCPAGSTMCPDMCQPLALP